MKRILSFGLILLISLLLCEGLARYLATLGNVTYSHTRELDIKYSLARQKNKGRRPLLLLLGNSYMMRGVYPELLAVRLQEQGREVAVRNLALSGSWPRLNLFLLRAAVDAGNRPAMVVYAVAPMMFNRSYMEKEHDAVMAFEQSFLGRCYGGSSHPATLECNLGRMFYLVRYRNFLKAELTGALGRMVSPKKLFRDETARFPLEEVSPGGWSPGYPVYDNAQFNLRYAPQQASKVQLKITERLLGEYRWDEADFKALQAYCRQQRLPLVYLRLPEHAVWRQYFARYGLSEPGFMQRLSRLAQADGVQVLNLQPQLPLDGHYFYNPDHLNVLGAIATTEQFARDLGQTPYTDWLQAKSTL